MRITAKAIDQAVQVLRNGGLVAFPTETVYGLGADARNARAVAKIFKAKGRPGTNPLIVHVSNAKMARRYAAHWPAAAEKLAGRFWPGPLSLVLAKTGGIVPQATAGQATVALRCPNHPLALRLLKAFGGPVAAPSANRSTRVSPTSAAHVRRQLGDKVDLILDGGTCRVGIESTVLDLTRKPPVLLRPGAITRRQIENQIGPIAVFNAAVAARHAAPSPGMQARHYAPATQAFRFSGQDWSRIHKARGAIVLAIRRTDVFEKLRASGKKIALLSMPPTPGAYARRLYSALHEADDRGPKSIWIQMPPDRPAWHAVRDRIRRATKAIG